MSGYVYDAGWEQERERLAGIEALWEGGTQTLLAGLGLSIGWSCLEVGAGGGATVEWLCEAVAESGGVLATDVDTRFIERLDFPQLDVRAHDVTSDALPEAAFDLVHARLLLEHLPDRAHVLDRLIGATRPGGWLVIEDYDWTGFGIDPEDGVSKRASEAILGFMAAAGFDPFYGRRLIGDFEERGLVDVRCEGRLRTIDARDPGFPFFKLSFEALREAVVDAGRLTAAEASEVSTRLERPDARIITPALIAAVGRRP